MQTIKMVFRPEPNDGDQVEISTEMIVDPDDLDSVAEAGDTAARLMLTFFRAFFNADLSDA